MRYVRGADCSRPAEKKVKDNHPFAILRFLVSLRLELESSFNRQDAKAQRSAKRKKRHMAETQSILNLGTPVPVDIGSIEQELTALWKSATDNEGESAVIRACSCNLVAVAQNQQEATSLPAVLAKVSEWHPCRSLIAYREEDGVPQENRFEAGMRAWISAQCWLPFAGGPQICCEAITLSLIHI